MKTIGCSGIIMILALAGSSVAGTVTTTSTAPTADGLDIANLTWASVDKDKVWTDTTNPGQSFTTGANGGILKAFAMNHNTTSSADPVPADKTWSIRVVTISGTDTTTVALETGHVSSGTWSQGDWYIWTLDTPLTLLPNTLYGIDVEMTAGGAWQQGIPYLRFNKTDDVAGGCRYTRVDGDPATISTSATWDRVFHIDMDAPPPPGTVFLFH